MQTVNIKNSAAKLCVAVIFAALAVSCQTNEIKISGRFIGGDSSVAYLEELSGFEGGIIDSVELTSSGEFAFKVKTKDNQHKLYNVVYDWSTIPLFGAAGDKITLNSVGNVAKNYTVQGSEESELVRRFYQGYIGGIVELDKIALLYGDESISEDERQELAKKYTAKYNSIKREQLEFIIENKANLAAAYALYQRLPNDSYLFTGRNDVIYYRTVAEALEQNYPDSPYRKNIQADIDEFDALNTLNQNILTLGFPELELNDVYGQKQKLSSLVGNVILVDFWSAQLGSSNRNNAELKELYSELQGKGFEVYQVGIDNSKSTWIGAIHEQSLPWISVSDLSGNRSRTLSIYNITAIPSNFIINREGDIVARDIYGDELRKLIKAEVAK